MNPIYPVFPTNLINLNNLINLINLINPVKNSIRYNNTHVRTACPSGSDKLGSLRSQAARVGQFASSDKHGSLCLQAVMTLNYGCNLQISKTKLIQESK